MQTHSENLRDRFDRLPDKRAAVSLSYRSVVWAAPRFLWPEGAVGLLIGLQQ